MSILSFVVTQTETTETTQTLWGRAGDPPPSHGDLTPASPLSSHRQGGCHAVDGEEDLLGELHRVEAKPPLSGVGAVTKYFEVGHAWGNEKYVKLNEHGEEININ